jgi:hypothetical protein
VDCLGESVGRVGFEVLRDGELEAVFADVAPGADGVGDDGDVVGGHCAGGGAEGQGGWLVGLVVWVELSGGVGGGGVRGMRCCVSRVLSGRIRDRGGDRNMRDRDRGKWW